MKSYYDFMFFSTVCSSFKRFKCVIQKLEGSKTNGNLSDPKNSGSFAKPPRNSSKICQPRKIEFGQISNRQK